MIDQLSRVAVENEPLLRALKAGGAGSPTELAELAGILPNHVHRKLDALEGEGWIVRDDAAPKHVATLTAEAERALHAMAVYEGRAPAGDGLVVEIAADLIDPWPDQPRTQFDEHFIDDLTVSIGDKGVLQPIVVRPAPAADGAQRFQVVIGENRRRASQRAIARGLQPPGFTIPCRVRELSDDEAFELAVTENVQREDLHWMDDAKSMLRLLNMGRSAAQISRIYGEKRGKRSINDYTKIARELPQDVLAQAYLPPKLDNGQPNPQCLTYTKARDLVGEKREKPALDLTPRLRLALVETIYAGLPDGFDLPLSGTVVTRFFKPPVGGPLGTLQDRKLIAIGFQGRDIVARTAITEEVARWLEQIGFNASPERALAAAQAEVLGELQANALGDAFATDELNEPEPPAAAVPLQAPQAEAPPPSIPATGAGDLPEGARYAGAAEDGDREDGDHAAAPSPPAAETLDLALEPKPLPPMLAIVLIELAHKIAVDGVERGPGTWAAPVLSTYYKDARGAQLIQGHKMMAFMPMGERTLAALAKAGREWLAAERGVQFDDNGRPQAFATLAILQRDEGVNPVGDGPYSTYWLNPPAEAPASSSPSPQGEVGEVSAQLTEGVSTQTSAAPPPPPRDTFSVSMAGLAAETRAWSSLAAAARETDGFLANLATKTKVKPDDVAAMRARLQQALEAVQPFLPQATQA